MAEGIKVEVTETQGSKVEEPQKVAQATPVKTEEPKYVKIEDLEKINQSIRNTREYNDRKLNEIKEQIERLVPKPVEKAPDDLDELVQKDWKAGVTKVVEGVLTQHNQRTQAQTADQIEARLRQESINKVMERHKELADSDSEKTKVFLKVLEDNPDFKQNPRGPLLAAYEMENRLKSNDTINSVERASQVSKETRSRAAGVPAGTSTGNKSAYSLSKADMDFCRHNNINPENYKKYRGMKEVS